MLLSSCLFCLTVLTKRTDGVGKNVEFEMVSGVCVLENDECICNFSFWIRGKVHVQTKNIISYNDSLFLFRSL